MAAVNSKARLLAGATAYAISCVSYVTPGVLSWPTPCAGWDVAMLLQHVNDSLTALHEGTATGYIGPGPADPAAGDPAAGLVATFRDRACQLLAAAATSACQDRTITIAGRHLEVTTLVAVAAIEVAVHGWDVAWACHCRRPIPPALATGLLKITPIVVTSATRNVLFAAPVATSPPTSASDRLLALLGRNPHAPTLTTA